MFRIYNAVFTRFPDASELEYWIDRFSSGVDDERAVASSFLVSGELKKDMETMSQILNTSRLSMSMFSVETMTKMVIIIG